MNDSKGKGSISHAFAVRIRTENTHQAIIPPVGPHKISVLIEVALGHLRYHLTNVPPQPNSPPDIVLHTAYPLTYAWPSTQSLLHHKLQPHEISEMALQVVVFQDQHSSHLYYIL